MKLHHLHWRCRNLAASLEFYQHHLGAALLKHYTTAYGLEIYLLNLHGLIIALSPAKEPHAAATGGIYQLALQVEDIEATVARMEAMGVKCKSGILEPTPGVKAAMFDDPEGVEIEFMQL